MISVTSVLSLTFHFFIERSSEVREKEKKKKKRWSVVQYWLFEKYMEVRRCEFLMLRAVFVIILK